MGSSQLHSKQFGEKLGNLGTKIRQSCCFAAVTAAVTFVSTEETLDGVACCPTDSPGIGSAPFHIHIFCTACGNRTDSGNLNTL